MHLHGGVVTKSFLVYIKKIMDGSMANQQGALPDPQPACHPATEDSADFEFAILDIESEILDVATALCVCIPATSMCAYLLPPERLAALSPANRLKLGCLPRLLKNVTDFRSQLAQSPNYNQRGRLF